MTSPPPPIDVEHAAAFWSRALSAGVAAPGTPQPSVERFGDSVELADELIELVVDGPKRATAGAVADYEHEGVPLPEPGHLTIAADGDGRARAVLCTTEVRVGPLSSVDDRFARDEGEGDRTREWWLAAHERFFRRYLPTIGVDFTPDLPVVFERFDVVYAE